MDEQDQKGSSSRAISSLNAYCGQLSPSQVRNERLPPTAVWLWHMVPNGKERPNLFDFVKQLPDQPDEGFLVAWHKPRKDPKEKQHKPVFGRFPSVQAYLQHMEAHPKPTKDISNFGFEIVRDGIDVKAFADYDKYINFTGEKTEDQLKEEGIACFKKEVISKLSLRIRDWFDGHTPLILVNECCRRSGNMYKLSFHVVVANLIFEKNHMKNMCMRVLFEDLSSEMEMDSSVYTSIRQMRMPNHCKGDRPDAPMSMLWELCTPGADADDTLALITVPFPASMLQEFNVVKVREGSSLKLEKAREKACAANLKSKRPRSAAPDGASSETPANKRQRVLSDRYQQIASWLRPSLQELLRHCGDKTTRVGEFVSDKDGKLVFECRNMGCARTCLLHPERNVFHESNNCRLFVVSARSSFKSGYDVEYTCMSAEKCPAKPRTAFLGTIGYDRSLLPNPQLMPAPTQVGVVMQEEEEVSEDEAMMGDDDNGDAGGEAERMEEGRHSLPACDKVCDEAVRELMLLAPFELEDPKTRELFAMCKTIDPGEGLANALLAWASRHPTFYLSSSTEEKKAEIFQLFESVHCDSIIQQCGNYDGILKRLNELRKAHPVVIFDQHALPAAGSVEETESVSEEAEEKEKSTLVLHCLQNRETMPWTCCVRVMKQVLPDKKELVLKFVKEVYKVCPKNSEAVWEFPNYPEPHLKQYCFSSVFNHSLFTITLPRLLCCPIRSYHLEDQLSLKLQLDSPCSAENLNELTMHLVSGKVAGTDVHIMSLPKNIFDSFLHNAEDSLARAIQEPCRKQLRMEDSLNEVFRAYESASGAWVTITEDKAINMVSEMLSDLLEPMLHLLSFRESQAPDPKKPAISPASKDLRHLLDKYVQCGRHTKEILKKLKPFIAYSFKEEPHYLCFENGVVNLRTGEFLGPAAPDLNIIHKVPHVYQPEPDNTDCEWNQVLHRFFPHSVYDDGDDIVTYLQLWWGYSITGKREIEAAPFITGKGSNGKTLLSLVLQEALGPQNCALLNMKAFNVSGIQNNDSLFQARFARVVLVQENSDSRTMNEETFKQITGGDPVSFAAKYKKGETVDTPMKLTFFSNNMPNFTSEYAIQRRVKNLPLRMQFLEPDGDQERRDELCGQNHSNWIADRDVGLRNRLWNTCIPAVLRWLIQGAVLYYKNQGKIKEPKTIRDSSIQERKDLIDLFQDFFKCFLDQPPFDFEPPHSEAPRGKNRHEDSLSCQEIIEVCCIYHDVNLPDIDDKRKNSVTQILKKVLVEDKADKYKNVEKVSPLTKYPTRDGPKDLNGYKNITWSRKDTTGKLARIVNQVRASYKNDNRVKMKVPEPEDDTQDPPPLPTEDDTQDPLPPPTEDDTQDPLPQPTSLSHQPSHSPPLPSVLNCATPQPMSPAASLPGTQPS